MNFSTPNIIWDILYIENLLGHPSSLHFQLYKNIWFIEIWQKSYELHSFDCEMVQTINIWTCKALWSQYTAQSLNLFIKAYRKITFKDLKITWKRCVLEMICFSLWFWLWCAFYNRSLKKHIILLSKCTSRLANKRIHIKLVSSVGAWASVCDFSVLCFFSFICASALNKFSRSLVELNKYLSKDYPDLRI